MSSLSHTSNSECYYLGDMPDDAQAARSSKTGYRGVGVILSSAEPENLRRELLQAGTDFILADPAALPGILGFTYKAMVFCSELR